MPSSAAELATVGAAAAVGAAIAIGSAVAYTRYSAPGSPPPSRHPQELQQLGAQEESPEHLPDASPMRSRKASRSTPRRGSGKASGASNVTRIVLTGGPCGGKSTCLNQVIKRLQENQYDVLVAPEMPTFLKNQCECPFPFVPNASSREAVHRDHEVQSISASCT